MKNETLFTLFMLGLAASGIARSVVRLTPPPILHMSEYPTWSIPMPRVEYIPDDFDFESGDGSPTVDLCSGCAGTFGLEEGARIEDFILDLSGEIGSTDVDHPSYDDPFEDYTCGACGEPLTEEDN
jgi:hypothetical protein